MEYAMKGQEFNYLSVILMGRDEYCIKIRHAQQFTTHIANVGTVEPPLSGLPRYRHLLQPGSYIWNFDLSIIHIM